MVTEMSFLELSQESFNLFKIKHKNFNEAPDGVIKWLLTNCVLYFDQV